MIVLVEEVEFWKTKYLETNSNFYEADKKYISMLERHSNGKSSNGKAEPAKVVFTNIHRKL